MDRVRLAELLIPYVRGLSDGQLAALDAYLELLLRWNARINLTSVREPDKIVTRHIGESLFAAACLLSGEENPHPSARRGQMYAGRNTRSLDSRGQHRAALARDDTEDSRLHLVDVGSGAGFPGLPTKIYAPEVRLTLIESQHKKAAFLREAIRTLALDDAEVFASRAEMFAARSGDLVTLRAVEQFERVLPVAAGLAKASGQLALLIGAAQVERAREILPQFHWAEAVRVPESKERVVLVGVDTRAEPVS